MEPIEDAITGREADPVQALAEYIGRYVRERWEPLWREHQEELARMYDQAGESAYGAYAGKLFRPVREQLQGAGFVTKPSFPGALPASREWGPPEERERWMWSVVSRRGGAPLGALVVGLVHDHTEFRIPRPPAVLALEETDVDGIVAALARSAGRPLGGEE